MDSISKRIDGSSVPSNQGKLVRLIGKLEQHDGSQATLASNGQIKLNLMTLSTDIDLEVGKNYEVIGQVGDDQGIKVYAVSAINDGFNFDNYYKLCSYIEKVPELFY